VTGLDVELRRAKPRAAFRVYCNRSKVGSPYYQVVILRSKRQVQRMAHVISGEPTGWKDVAGFCKQRYTLTRNRAGKFQRPSKCVGWVFMAAPCIGSGYAAHELTHAAHFRLIDEGYAETRLLDRALIEPLAEMVEWLTTQFWLEYYSRFHGEEK
jgi:hypothetical protein